MQAFEPWVVGGTVRDALMQGTACVKDVDMVVPNQHFANAVEEAHRLFGPWHANRHNNPRFCLPSGLNLDLWCPSRFFEGFDDIVSMLNAVDFSCNALAYSLSAGLIGVGSAISDLDRHLLRPIGTQWYSQSPTELAHVLGRAVRFVREKGFVPVNSDLFSNALIHLDPTVLHSRYGLDVATARRVVLCYL